MRSLSCFMGVIGMVLVIGQGTGSLVYGKTIEAGESSASWNGTGELMEIGNGEQVINGTVKGVLMSRHKDGGKLIVHSSRLVCPVRVNLNRTKDTQVMDGICTIVAHEGKDIAYANWKCSGNLKECEGQFTFTSGSGGFTGISGTTPFQTSIVFEMQEGKNVQALGYAIWPNLTHNLP